MISPEQSLARYGELKSGSGCKGPYSDSLEQSSGSGGKEGKDRNKGYFIG